MQASFLFDTKLSLGLAPRTARNAVTNSLVKSPEKEQEKEANNHHLLDLNLAPEEQSPVKNSLSDDCEMNNENSGSRKKLKLSKEQSSILEECFTMRMPDSEQKNRLASELKISRRQVESWFQNRRSRSKQEKNKKTYEEQAAKIERLERELEMEKLNAANFPPVPLNEHGDYECPNCRHNLSKVKDYLSNMED